MENTITMISLKKIKEGRFNTRGDFDKEGLESLAQSIKEVGLLQPIIVRPDGPESYEVVAGERRLKAAKFLKMKEIACDIRELTNDQAKEITITENLQRKDITPMEECRAYGLLMESPEHTMEVISRKFGKSETYIRTRLYLQNLTEEFKELLDTNNIPLAHVLEICKLPRQSQEELFLNYFKGYKEEYWNCPKLKTLKKTIENNFSNKLSNATWSLGDTFETTSCQSGACNVCPSNTASDMILFPESPKKGICLDPACYKLKRLISFQLKLERVEREEPGILIGTPQYIFGEDEKQVKALRKNGVPIIELGQHSNIFIFEKPEPPDEPIPPDPKDYVKGKKSEEYKESLSNYNDEIKEYKDDLNTYETDLKNYEEGIKSNTAQKMFMVAGNEKGKIVYVKRTIPQLENEKSDEKSSDSAILLLTQIQELKDKRKRNDELCIEHVHEDIRKFMRESDYIENITRPFTKLEWQGVFIVIMQVFRLPDSLQQKYFSKNKDEAKYDVADKLSADLGLASDAAIVMRSWLINELDQGSPLYKKSEAAILVAIALEKYPEEAAALIKVHQDNYSKRNGNIDVRIKELKDQIQEQKKEETKVKSKKGEKKELANID